MDPTTRRLLLSALRSEGAGQASQLGELAATQGAGGRWDGTDYAQQDWLDRYSVDPDVEARADQATRNARFEAFGNPLDFIPGVPQTAEAITRFIKNYDPSKAPLSQLGHAVVDTGAAGVAANFLPGSGAADYFSGTPGVNSSFGENVRRGDYGMAANQVVNLGGDMLSAAVPLSAVILGMSSDAVRQVMKAIEEQPDITRGQLWDKFKAEQWADGRWYTEMPDTDPLDRNVVNRIQGPNDSVPLQEVWPRTDDLYQRFPGMGDTPVSWFMDNPAYRGGVNPDTNTMQLNILDPEPFKTVPHETTHLIQNAQKTVSGGNPGMFDELSGSYEPGLAQRAHDAKVYDPQEAYTGIMGEAQARTTGPRVDEYFDTKQWPTRPPLDDLDVDPTAVYPRPEEMAGDLVEPFKTFWAGQEGKAQSPVLANQARMDEITQNLLRSLEQGNRDVAAGPQPTQRSMIGHNNPPEDFPGANAAKAAMTPDDYEVWRAFMTGEGYVPPVRPDADIPGQIDDWSGEMADYLNREHEMYQGGNYPKGAIPDVDFPAALGPPDDGFRWIFGPTPDNPRIIDWYQEQSPNISGQIPDEKIGPETPLPPRAPQRATQESRMSPEEYKALIDKQHQIMGFTPAVKFADGTVKSGSSHYGLEADWKIANGSVPTGMTDGFVDRQGTFLTRDAVDAMFGIRTNEDIRRWSTQDIIGAARRDGNFAPMNGKLKQMSVYDDFKVGKPSANPPRKEAAFLQDGKVYTGPDHEETMNAYPEMTDSMLLNNGDETLMGTWKDGTFHPYDVQVAKDMDGILKRLNSGDMTQMSIVMDDLNARLAHTGGSKVITRGGEGRFIGAPDGISTPKAEAALVDRITQKVLAGTAGKDFYTDYQNAMRNATSDPVKARELATLTGHTSPQTTPEQNHNYAVKGLNQRTVGDQIDTGMFHNANRKRIEASLESGRLPDDPKTGQYAYNIMPPELRPKDFGEYAPVGGRTDRPVHDTWDFRAFGYKNESGSSNIQRHAYMDSVYDQVIERLNADPKTRALAGPDGWNNENAQAAVWAAERGTAMDAGKHAVNEVKSAQTIFDNAKGITQMAAIPGRSTGVSEDLLNAPLKLKEAYTKTMFDAIKDESGASVIARSLGLSTPMKEGYGPWQGMMEPNRVIDMGVAGEGFKMGDKKSAPRAIDKSSDLVARTMRRWHQIALGQEGSGFTFPYDKVSTANDANLARVNGVALKTRADYNTAFEAARQIWGDDFADKVVVQPTPDGTLSLKNIGDENPVFHRNVEAFAGALGGEPQRMRDVGNQFDFVQWNDPSYRGLLDETRENPKLKAIFDNEIIPALGRVQEQSDLWSRQTGMSADTVPDRLRRIITEAGPNWPKAIDAAVKKGVIPMVAGFVALQALRGQLAGDGTR